MQTRVILHCDPVTSLIDGRLYGAFPEHMGRAIHGSIDEARNSPEYVNHSGGSA